MKLRDIKDDYGTAFYFVADQKNFIPYLITTGVCDVNILALKVGAPANFNDDGAKHILNNEVVVIILGYIQNSNSQT